MKTILILSFVALSFTAHASAQYVDKLPTITIVGVVEVEAVPDEVNISLEVSKIHKDLQTAKRLHDESVSRILDLTRRFDVNPNNVKTAFISVQMKYETVRDPKRAAYDEDGVLIGTRVFKGYEVSKTVVIKLTDVSRFEQFFEEVLRIGVTEVNNVSFETSKFRELKVQARELAIKAAREKAVAMAGAVDQLIGKAIYIGEGEGIVSASGRSNNYIISGSDNNDLRPSGNSSDIAVTFAPGVIRVKASVTIVFILN
jgi:uncharacterized protein